MKAMIMAADPGIELYPLTKDIPKCMLPVVNQPVIERVIGNLKTYGITDIIIDLYQNEDYIKDRLEDGGRFGVRLAYSEEEQPLGTAGGAKKASWFFDEETTVIASSGGVTNINLTEFLEFHHERKALATVALSSVSDPHNYDVVEIDERGRISQFQEKPKESPISSLANMGIYAFERKIFDLIPDGEYDFCSHLFPLFLKENIPFYGYLQEAYWNDIGTLGIYRQVQYDILMRKVNLAIPGKETRPGISVGENTYIDEDAELLPPIVVGNHVRIEKNVRLKGPLSINDHCKIEESAQIERSIILSNCTIGREVQIKEAILGRGSVIKNRVVLMEKNVVGSFVLIEENSVLHPKTVLDCKVEVPKDTEITEDIIRE
jgi:mannose-1-phosphate guanylyltransferase/phosphomannomutase